MSKLLIADSISKTFGKAASKILALNDISLELNKGEFILISGPSGSGKTTLLQVLGLLTRPDSGSISVLNQAVAGLTDNDLSRLRLNTYGFVYQDFKLIRALTAVENVMLPLLAKREPNKKARKKAESMLARFDMSERLNSTVESLSGGERQRVAIARALINDPEILLADEPTANLDTLHGQQIMRLLKALTDTGIGIIVVSHDERLEPFVSKKLTIRDGKLV